MLSIDDEWNQYLMNQYELNNGGIREEYSALASSSSAASASATCENAWTDDSIPPEASFHEDWDCEHDMKEKAHSFDEIQPVCTELYISTITKVLFLNQEIDIHRIFWEIPTINYWEPTIGVVKKQIKVVSNTLEEFEKYQQNLQNTAYYSEHIIKQINNPNARRNKFKDERKITIGLSKKDIINSRGKVKGAFYNCFAVIMRLFFQNEYKEVHVKIFNTGKLEIPGVGNIEILDCVKVEVLNLLQKYFDTPLEYLDSDHDGVLINSNFNCGYFINHNKLYNILKSEKYGIESSYDRCQYPGVKCRYYFNNKIGFDHEKQNGRILPEDNHLTMDELIKSKDYTKVSFMIFRTGNTLISGNSSLEVILFIYEFLKKILIKEYKNLYILDEKYPTPFSDTLVKKKSKSRRKMVPMTNSYYTSIMPLND